MSKPMDEIKPKLSEGAFLPRGTWYTTCSIAPEEMDLFRNTPLKAADLLWICKFCSGLNKFEHQFCFNCHAPLTDDVKVIDFRSLVK